MKSKLVETVKQDPSVPIKRVYNTVVRCHQQVNQNLSAATPRNYSCSHFSVENYFFGARILWELFIPLKGIAIYQS
jgi:hypothetical protein